MEPERTAPSFAARRIVRLRRGEATRRTLADALDQLGIERGQEFVICGIDLLRPTSAPGPAVRDSDTSKRAALLNAPRAGTQRWRVLMIFARHGPYGATRDEVWAQLRVEGGVGEGAVDARVWELGPRNGGFIEPNGEERRTPAGGMAEVLVLTEKGRAAVEAR